MKISDNKIENLTENQQNSVNSRQIIITESPRDAIQGLKYIIPTNHKITYINSLLKAGFDIIDIGSFVSAKAIPQMADTAKVLEGLDLSVSDTKIMVLVANEKGAEIVPGTDQIQILSFPFSVSETFLRNNIRSNFQKAFDTALRINEICFKSNKKFLCYLTMGLGNPYGDPWHPEIVLHWIEKFRTEDINYFNISDITGEADPVKIKDLFNLIFSEFPELNVGIHLHTDKFTSMEKIEAAWNAGVRQFDTVLGGFGGCPMTGYELLGNLNTFDLLEFCTRNQISVKVDRQALKNSKELQQKLFTS